MSLDDRTDPRAPDPRRPTAAEWLAAPTPAGSHDLVVVGVPRFTGSVAPSGAHAAPAAVRRSLAGLTTYAPSRGVGVGGVLVLDRGDVPDADGEEGEWRVRMAASTAATTAKVVLGLGGDSSVTPPLVDAVCGATIETTGVVLVSPQYDLRPGRTSASTTRWLLELGVTAGRIVQVGLADWAESASYVGEARELGIRTFPGRMVAERGMPAVMADALDLAGGGGGRVCVALDLGVADPAVAPGCRRALPGGLSAAAVRDVAFAAGCDERVAAATIVEVDPSLDHDGRTVRLAALCLLEVAAGLAVRNGQPAR
ncbi:formimidoylglutamase [Acidothermaceae bacterium B102]|nr:formimidoylglutamase [Acidothermaceae bacterium B102]